MPLSRITSPFQSATANVYSPSANTVAIRTASADRVTVDSTGSVGFGTTSPFSTSGATVLSVGGSSSNTSGRLFLRDNSNNNQVQLYINPTFNEIDSQSELNLRTESGAMRITTANSERARFEANGVFNLISGQIQFPATQNASSNPNTLDDYEEGTWTPVLGYSGGNGTMSVTYANQFGWYTKIGNLVYLRCDLRLTSFTKGTASGSPWIVGLPFTPQNNAGYGSAIFVAGTYQWAFSSSPPIASVRQDGTPAIQLSRMVSNSVHANLDDPDGDAMIFQTVVYQV